ncbi:hypothetical protein G4D82_06690 [Flavobacterium sp. CYK-4]|uniref:hypothetical protein n=1 Tax=Flavobacterium lotistagni TaxID=2709660 RepID=UPI00140DB452|nr:hypothetical protein [Flavobacterium lotistagni]NHM06902.1 hypothetical protein [Flavobacterium lotistagni]
MEKETWINQVLESTNGKQTAIPNAQLFGQILERLEDKIPMRWVWVAAASLLLLVALNVKLVYFKSSKQKSATEIMASQLSKSNQLY